MDTEKTEWFLRGNWAPLGEEKELNNLKVDGSIPTELDGIYVRTGPNPKDGKGSHWFLGDGMVHGIRLKKGKAEWYRNRFVQTPDITEPLTDPMAGLGDLRRGKGNTHVVAHNEQIMCLEEAHWPWTINADLETTGVLNYEGKLDCSMTAHPKICPITGELLAFSYFSFEQPYLKYIRVSADGKLQQLEGIELPEMVMMHDFNITRNFVIFMDLPLALDLELLSTGIPFRFKRDKDARLGVLPRNGESSEIRWFQIDPCYVFHQVNSWEENNKIVLIVSRQDSAFGEGSGDYSNVGRLYKWTIDLDRGTVNEEPIDDRAGDFGRVNDSFVGLQSRYGYLMSLDGEGNSEEPVYGPNLYKYDLTSGACQEHYLGQDVRGAEPVFAASARDSGEDAGWIMSLVHSEKTGKSKFVILDAQNFEAKPVATIELPFRVPYGAHGNWIPAESVH